MTSNEVSSSDKKEWSKDSVDDTSKQSSFYSSKFVYYKSSGTIISKALEDQMHNIVNHIQRAIESNITLPHILIHGPHGNGKIELAKSLAHSLHIQYLIISEHDINSFDQYKNAYLEKLIHYSSLPMILIIENADTVLSISSPMTSNGNHQYKIQLCNTIIQNFRNNQKNIILVLTTTTGKNLNKAILDRIDIILHVPNPSLEHRRLFVVHSILNYLSQYLDRSSNEKLTEYVIGME
jgi:SpoVK/Ycf46/Vps4 family AAA+-type ATPase